MLFGGPLRQPAIATHNAQRDRERKKREGKMGQIPRSTQSKRGYNLTHSRLDREHLIALGSQQRGP